MESRFSCGDLDIDSVAQSGHIQLDCKELASHENVAGHLTNFIEDLRDSPENMINCIGGIHRAVTFLFSLVWYSSIF